MAFSYVFTSNISMTTGNPTKASEGTNLGMNTSALKERFVVGHCWNNTGVTNEDGFHKADYSNPIWFYAKTTGSASYKYVGLWLYVNGATSHLRMKIQGSTAAPANPTAGVAFMLGEYS